MARKVKLRRPIGGPENPCNTTKFSPPVLQILQKTFHSQQKRS